MTTTKESVIYFSYHYFDPDAKEKTVRIAKANIGNSMPINEQDNILFEDIYEALPAIRYDISVDSAFRSNRHGGRLVLLNNESLLLVLGDNQYDGVAHERRDSEDDKSDYGKAIKIDLNTGNKEYLAKGLRNPQGLLVTKQGDILETEHGPQGGDELNLLLEGNDYGWPSVSYGVDYGSDTWPLQKEVGRHEGFTKPLITWLPSIATSNLIQASYPSEWRGDLLIGTLKESALYRTRYEEGRVVFVERVHVGERIRDLEQLDDGTIVLWTDNARLWNCSL